MKKITSVVLFVISCVALVFLIFLLPHNVRLEGLMVDEGQLNHIIQSRTENIEQMFDNILFDGEAIFLDKENRTFYYSLQDGDGNAYNPYVVVEAASRDVKIAFDGKKISEDTIRNNEGIKVVIYDDDCYSEYDLKCTTLPIMNIVCQSEISEDDKAPMSVALYDNRKGATQKTMVSDGTIHLRGGSTLTYPKKPYRISLTKKTAGNDERSNKVSLLGMRQDDDWILYPAYNDQEKIRNVFSANLWKYTCASDNSLGVDNGIEYKYIELFMNGQYWGLYALGYPLDSLQLDVDASKGERIYKKNTWEDETYITLEKGKPVEGYTTDEADEDVWKTLKQYYVSLDEKWSNPEAMYGGIDVDNAIDVNLFINLIQGLDHSGALGCMSIKNMYITMKKTEAGFVALYTPWDMDISWGNEWTGDSDTNLTMSYGINASQNTIMESGNLGALMSNDKEIWGLILEKYRFLRQKLWSMENLNSMLDEYEKDIYGSGAYLREMERWPDGSYWKPETGLDTFREYVAERLEKLDEYYDRVEKLLDSNNIYIIRSAQYEDFTSLRFIYELNDRGEITDNEDYKEFIEYIGIDVDDIPDGARYILVDGEAKRVEYYDTFEETGNNTCIGYVECHENAADENLYDVYVDGTIWYSSYKAPNKENVLAFISKDGVASFDFTQKYIMWANLIQGENPREWCDIVKKNGYGVVVEITNHDIIGSEKFGELLEGLGISLDDITPKTDFIVINQEGETSVVDNGHNSGDRNDTALGEISVFYNEMGGYGVYLDGNECILVNEQEASEIPDIRISVMNNITNEVVWSGGIVYN